MNKAKVQNGIFCILVILFLFRNNRAKFFLSFERASRDAGHDVLRFLKKSFLCPKKVVYKIYMQFFDHFLSTLTCENVFELMHELFKNRRTSCPASRFALSNEKKIFRLLRRKIKITRMRNRPFLVLVWFITSLNKQISG